MLKQRGVDCVCRLTSHRRADFRRGKSLGRMIILGRMEEAGRSRRITIDRKTYDTLPEFLPSAKCRVGCEHAAFGVWSL